MQLILEMSAYFLLFTGLLYDLYIIVTNPSVERRYLRVTVLIVWITVYFMQLLIINRTCENISYEVMQFIACRFDNIIEKYVIETNEFFEAVTSNR